MFIIIYFKEIVRRQGLNNITVDELVSDITPRARELVPDQVKRELVQRIREFLLEQNNTNNSKS